MTQKNPKTVFAVINLTNTEKEQKNVAKYAAQLAKKLELTLVLYPMMNDNSFFVKKNTQEKFNRVADIAVQMHDITPMRIAQKFTSITDIAKQEHAALIVMEVDESAKTIGGNIMWQTIKNSHVPIYLLPKNFKFKSINSITIAVDGERKIQKVNTIDPIVKAFNSTVNIFTDKGKTEDEKFLIMRCLAQIRGYFESKKIPYEITTVRKLTKFITRICKFSAKHTDLLVLEVDDGPLDKVIKQNVKTLLTLWTDPIRKIEPTPVMMIKTRMTGKLQNFR